MAVKLNAMLMIILWANFLPLICSHRRPYWTKAPVCEAYNLHENATWIARTSCDEHKKFRFSCAVGQVAKVETVCKKGKWIEELACQAVQCPAGERFNNTDEASPLGIFDQTYNLKCSIGATRNGTFLTVQCSADGDQSRWVVINSCALVLCPSTQQVIRFENTEPAGTPIGQRKDKKCASGYTRKGDDGSVECSYEGGKHGTWKTIKDCGRVMCPSSLGIIDFESPAVQAGTLYAYGHRKKCASGQLIREKYGLIRCDADGRSPNGTWTILLDC